jgi:phthalate 4,5-cis-dihydrodiol dehydrogenase
MALRLGIVGMGTAARQLLPAVDKRPEITVTAICDPLPAAREAVASRYNARALASLDEMLSDDLVDAVYIATPTDLHAAQVIDACNAGKHVLCEKPMATTLHEAQAMIDAATRAGVVFQVGHSHSYDEPYRAMRELIATGELGRPRLLHNMYYSDWVYRPRRPEELDENLGGGITFRQGAHQFDILRLLGGGRVKSLRAQTFDWDKDRHVIGAHSVFLTFEDGTVATAIYNGYGAFMSSEITYDAGEVGYPQTVSPGSSRAKLKAAGAAAEAQLKVARAGAAAEDHLAPNQPFFGWTIVSCEGGDIRQSATGLYIYTERGREERPLRLDRTTREPVVEEFLDVIAGRREPLHNGEWARANLECCVATIASGKTGAEITLKHQRALPPGM